MLRNKSDALQVFKNYKRKVDNLLVKCTKKLGTDNGKEYMFKEFALFKEYKFLKRRRYKVSVECVHPTTKWHSGTSQSYTPGDW